MGNSPHTDGCPLEGPANAPVVGCVSPPVRVGRAGERKSGLHCKEQHDGLVVRQLFQCDHLVSASPAQYFNKATCNIENYVPVPLVCTHCMVYIYIYTSVYIL